MLAQAFGDRRSVVVDPARARELEVEARCLEAAEPAPDFDRDRLDRKAWLVECLVSPSWSLCS